MNAAAKEQYLLQKIESASALGRIIILYDSCLLFMREAIKQHKADNRVEFVNKNIRAQNIIRELRNALNIEVDPKTGGNLYRLYTFFLKKLMEANREKSIEPMEFVIEQMTSLNEAWQEAERKGLGADVKRFEDRLGSEDVNIIRRYKSDATQEVKKSPERIKTLNVKI